MKQQIDRDKIKNEAKRIINKFAKAIEKVEKEEENDQYIIVKEKFLREEENSKNKIDPDFKKRILTNAPRKDMDFIIAEKGDWK